jgi:hypothetical protein
MAQSTQLWEEYLNNTDIDERETLTTRGCGHDGIAEDIRLIWRNCSKYMSRHSEEHPLVESAMALSTVFESLYENRVLLPLRMQTATAAKPNRFSMLNLHSSVEAAESKVNEVGDGWLETEVDDWHHFIRYLSKHEYSNAAVDVKLFMLTWACNELLQTKKCRLYMEKIMENLLKSVHSKTPSKSREADLDVSEANEATEPPKKKKAVSTSMVRGHGDMDTPGKSIPTVSTLPSVVVGSHDALQSSEFFEETIRLISLGKDRHSRVYWAFNEGPLSPSVPPRIFCEDPLSSEWHIFSDERDLIQLTGWLCDRGVREVALKRAIVDWAHRNGVAAIFPKSADPVCASKIGSKSLTTRARRKSGSEHYETVAEPSVVSSSDIIDAATSSDAVPIRPEDTFPFRSYPDLTNFWAPKEGNPISFSVFIYLNEEFQLGIGLKSINSYVIVSSIKADAEGRSAGRESGVRVGDVVLAVENQFVTDIETIKTAISVLRSATSLTKSSSLGGDLSTGPRASDADGYRKSQRGPVVPSSSVGEVTPRVAEDSLPTRPCLRLLVLRFPSLSLFPPLKEACDADGNLRAAYKRQEEQDVENTAAGSFQYLQLPNVLVDPKRLEIRPDGGCHPLRETNYYPSRIVGTVVSLIIRSMHPFCVPEEYISRSAPSWMCKLFDKLVKIDETALQHTCLVINVSSTPLSKRHSKMFGKLENQLAEVEGDLVAHSSDLLKLLVEGLLSYEEALAAGGNMLQKVWLDQRQRFKWRRICQFSQTFSNLANCANILTHTVEWGRLGTACTCLTLAGWTTKVPKYIKTSLPAENSLVVYFGDGHLAEDFSDLTLMKPKMWGSTSQLRQLNKGKVLSCIVTAIRVLLCGPPERFFPFAQVDLSVVSSKLSQATPIFAVEQRANSISSRTSTSYLGRLYRSTNRIVNIIRVLPEAKAFLDPVSVTDHPDYYDVVVDPVDLSMIRLRAREGYYTRVDAFLEDMSKLRDNCQKYCAELYPDLVVCANRLLEETTTLAKVMSDKEPYRDESGFVSSVSTSAEPSTSQLSEGNGSVATQRNSCATAPLSFDKKGSVLKGIPLAPVCVSSDDSSVFA